MRRRLISLELGFADETLGYAIDLGLPILPPPTLFAHDPEIKAEALWSGPALGARIVLALRAGLGVRLRADSGAWRQALTSLAPFDSMMTHCAAPGDGLIVVSHAPALVDALREHGANTVRLIKPLGETVVEDAGLLDWSWPAR